MLTNEKRSFRHHVRKNTNVTHDQSLTTGQRIADKVAATVGAWKFVIFMTILLGAWIVWNTLPFTPHFDAAPFILLNLCLSFLAGYQAPFIMMSQNRQAEKDRITADETYHSSKRDEEETRDVLSKLEIQYQEVIKHTEILEGQNKELLKQTKLLEQFSNNDIYKAFLEKQSELLKYLIDNNKGGSEAVEAVNSSVQQNKALQQSKQTKKPQ